MNHKANLHRVRAFEEIYGPCTCELYGPCVLCVALSETDGFPTFNAAVTGPWAVYQHRGGEPDLTVSAGGQVSFTIVERDE